MTPEEVQQYLNNENENLINAIRANMTLGRLHECAKYQERLRKNFMYLAAIADWQVQKHMNPTPRMQQHGISPQNMSLQFGNPQQQTIQGQTTPRTPWIGNDLYPMHSEVVLGGHTNSTGSSSNVGLNDASDGSMQGSSEGTRDVHGSSTRLPDLNK
ncbi:GRF1-interacting factor 3-like [Cajanus cajan]|uniref:GRF1-interacting factor 3-like n=1 Tax=Cajanus cajan TaxID=3821 RepID=UPI00098DB19B|nr:GRF1-interacting factor 3-like [Cajanus cajan]